MNVEKILITGGSGFLGGYLVKSALSEYQVLSTYFSNRSDYPDVQWLHLDLGRSEKIKDLIMQNRPQIVIHNAAMTNVDACEKQIEQTKIINIQACETISAACKTIGARILYISSDLVFDGDSPPYSENDVPKPISTYGLSKWQGELAVAANNPNHVIIRAAIIYGPTVLSGTSFSEQLRICWEKGEVTNLFTDQIRTPIFGGNIADAIIELSKTDYVGVLNLAGPERITRYKFALYLVDLLEFDKDLLNPVGMNDVRLTVKRPSDVSLKNDLVKKILKTRLLGCREGIECAYGAR